MTVPIDSIPGADRLVEIFGAWPSFHDAEVLRLRLDRHGASDSTELEAEIHVFEMTSNVTAEGFCERRNHVRVTLVFEGFEELDLEGFNGQNALFRLGLVDISGRAQEAMKWEVSFDASYGVAAVFRCARIRVASVEPFEPPG